MHLYSLTLLSLYIFITNLKKEKLNHEMERDQLKSTAYRQGNSGQTVTKI
jgi:hypothetical protein